jgi:hypothetical protein
VDDEVEDAISSIEQAKESSIAQPMEVQPASALTVNAPLIS